jgi:hypothetical protein
VISENLSQSCQLLVNPIVVGMVQVALSTKLHVGLAALSYSLIVLFLKNISSRDPTSIFFQSGKAFTPDYSEIRRMQAEIYINNASSSVSSDRPTTDPRLCVGVTSVQRLDLHLDVAIGSLLQGLTGEERNAIHLMVLIANTDPGDHDSYHTPWLHDLADQVLTYKDIPDDRKARLMRLEREDPEHRVKPLLDYTHLLEACAVTGAAHVLMLEDDVVAAGTWFRRTNTMLQQLEQHQDFDKSVYVRLFYTSHLLGWNSEDWFSYLLHSVIVLSVSFAILSLLQRCHRAISMVLTAHVTRVIVLVHVPACILFYYAAGRLTVAPLRSGLRPMDRFGCCSQALVFPRRVIPDLITFYRDEGIGFVDVLTEVFADKHDLRRWALVPSAFQHIGMRSSKGDDYRGSRWNRSVAANIWNFDFEMFGEGK